ncbi:MAG: hypothetical protein XD74_0742 [Actinobacteria bacterium 66_15]|nr:MAG: hypothetical protein XD74_0742 [Actinobacteria bacterium 66_15]
MTTKDPVTKTTLWVVVAVVLALAVGALAGWFARSGEVRDLEDRIAASEEESATDEPATPAEPETDTAPVEPPAEEEPAEEDEEPVDVPVAAERVPAIITAVDTSGSTVRLEVDYIQFLTGDEAADAATAHGDESPPPNDYYIVNDNPALREFPVQEGVSVVTVVNDDGTSDPAGHTLTLDEWVDRITGPNADAFRSSFYWITVSEATITTIEQQYLP